MKNQDYLDELCKQGAERASRLAMRTLSKVQKKVGFVPLKR
jgi:tryptophanyl-tRNA synthetase